MNTAPAGRWRIEYVMAAMAVALGVLVTVVDPAASSLVPPCPFRLLTGWLCPGCGSARALHALAHGHVMQALGLNPVAVAVLPAAATDWVRRLSGRPGLPVHRLPAVWVWALGAALVAFGVARNL